jgi:serine/threonine-protein kinase RsbT
MMLEDTRVLVEHEEDIVTSRQKGRELAIALGFLGHDPTLIATAVSELARNIILYAGRGTIVISPLEYIGKRGIRVIAQDNGPGIADVAAAMHDGYSTGKSLGLGLPGTRRIMDKFEIASAVGVGTTVTVEKWVC